MSFKGLQEPQFDVDQEHYRDHPKELKKDVHAFDKQLHYGVHPDQIKAHFQKAGLHEKQIKDAFDYIHSQRHVSLPRDFYTLAEVEDMVVALKLMQEITDEQKRKLDEEVRKLYAEVKKGAEP